MNQGLRILLEGEGFRLMRPQSCEFAKTYSQSEATAYLFRVWLHRNGGQAEVCADGTGRRIARLPLWRSMDELIEFFKAFQ